MAAATSDTFTTLLTSWFKKNQRGLTWRLTRDPYRIWISEVMLQQTQVATVIPYYEKFLEAFPSLPQLAKAPEEQILHLWSGLGYYSRARNLHRGAQYLLEVHQGIFPQTREALLKIPGIGPYTAGALLSIAFNLKEALVDGNVERVFSRYYGFTAPIDTPSAKKFFWTQAERLVTQASSPRLFNQGLMELGSLVCTKANPQCGICPLAASCMAFKKNLTGKLPFKKTKRPYESLHQIKFIFEKKGKWWLKKNGLEDWWSGLWDFPTYTVPEGMPPLKGIEKVLKQYQPVAWKELSHVKHTVTHHKLQVIPLYLRVRQAPPFEGQWFPPEEISQLPVSALVKKIIVHDLSPPC